MGLFLTKRKVRLDGAEQEDGWLLTLEGPFLTKRKIIILDGAEQEDGWLLTLEGPFLTKRKIILDGAEQEKRMIFNARRVFFREKKNNIGWSGARERQGWDWPFSHSFCHPAQHPPPTRHATRSFPQISSADGVNFFINFFSFSVTFGKLLF